MTNAVTLELANAVNAAMLEVANAEMLETSEEVSEEVAEGVYTVAVAKGSTFYPSKVSEAESDEGLTHEDIIKQHVINEHARLEKEAATVARLPSKDTY